MGRLTHQSLSHPEHDIPSDPQSPMSEQPLPLVVEAAHALYCRMTGQNLSLRFDRIRLWSEFFQTGFTIEDLQWVLSYLQKEIRAGRRNIGALKLRNLLAPDRFEEDYHISRVRLRPKPSTSSVPQPPLRLAPAEEERLRREASRAFQHLRANLRGSNNP
jgi:hypothetical protein